MLILQARGLHKRFAGVQALADVALDVRRGEVHSVIGPNGAGKSTLFNIVAGALRPSGGRIDFGDRRIDGLPPHLIYRQGIARTFQIPKPFGGMSVLENAMLAPLGQSGESFWNTLLRPGRVRAEERANRDKAREILAFSRWVVQTRTRRTHLSSDCDGRA